MNLNNLSSNSNMTPEIAEELSKYFLKRLIKRKIMEMMIMI